MERAIPDRRIETRSSWRSGQARVLDIEARGGRKVDALPPELLAEVLARVVTLFE
jgi:mRNA interferase ChpB